MDHGVQLCSGITQPRCDSSPVLNTATGEKVTDYSWTCPTKTSCWNKFHEFYEPKGLFARKVINIAEAVHHHLNGREKDTSREERRVGDHQ